VLAHKCLADGSWRTALAKSRRCRPAPGLQKETGVALPAWLEAELGCGQFVRVRVPTAGATSRMRRIRRLRCGSPPRSRSARSGGRTPGSRAAGGHHAERVQEQESGQDREHQAGAGGRAAECRAAEQPRHRARSQLRELSERILQSDPRLRIQPPHEEADRAAPRPGRSSTGQGRGAGVAAEKKARRGTGCSGATAACRVVLQTG
jgi:hypothetical protein